MEDRNTQVKALMAGWQGRFHDLYDAAQPAENDGPRPEAKEKLGQLFRLMRKILFKPSFYLSAPHGETKYPAPR